MYFTYKSTIKIAICMLLTYNIKHTNIMIMIKKLNSLFGQKRMRLYTREKEQNEKILRI